MGAVHHVLVIEDDPGVGDLVKTALESEARFQVTCAADGSQARSILQRDRPDLAIIDALLPDEPGLKLAEHIARADIPVLLTTGDPYLLAGFTALGLPCLAKPFHIGELVANAKAALETPLEVRRRLIGAGERVAATVAKLKDSELDLDAALARLRAAGDKQQP